MAYSRKHFLVAVFSVITLPSVATAAQSLITISFEARDVESSVLPLTRVSGEFAFVFDVELPVSEIPFEITSIDLEIDGFEYTPSNTTLWVSNFGTNDPEKALIPEFSIDMVRIFGDTNGVSTEPLTNDLYVHFVKDDAHSPLYNLLFLTQETSNELRGFIDISFDYTISPLMDVARKQVPFPRFGFSVLASFLLFFGLRIKDERNLVSRQRTV